MQQIHDLLVSLGAAPTDIAFKSYTLTHIDAQEADDKVRAMFGLQRGVESVAEGARSRSYDRGGEMRDRDGRPIPMPAPTNTKPKVQVSYDERTNRLLVTANPAEHKIIEELLKTIDVEELPGATRRRAAVNRTCMSTRSRPRTRKRLPRRSTSYIPAASSTRMVARDDCISSRLRLSTKRSNG